MKPWAGGGVLAAGVGWMSGWMDGGRDTALVYMGFPRMGVLGGGGGWGGWEPEPVSIGLA